MVWWWLWNTKKSLLAAFLIALTFIGLASANNIRFCMAQGSTQAPTEISVTQLWRSQVEGSLVHDPIVVGSYVYAVSGWSGGNTGYLNCLSATDGNQLWNFSVLQYNSPVVAEGYLYTGSDDGNFYALNASTGTQIWNKKSIGDTPVPAVAGGYVYFGCFNTYGGSVFSLNASTGTEIWNYMEVGTSFRSPIITDEIAYAVSAVYTYDIRDSSWRSAVYAFNSSNGKKIWNYTSTGYFGSPVAAVLSRNRVTLFASEVYFRWR